MNENLSWKYGSNEIHKQNYGNISEHAAALIHRIPRCRLGLSQHPAIRLVCVVNVVVTAIAGLHATCVCR
jgi:hypothetical protein